MEKTIRETEKRSPKDLVKEAMRRANRKEKQEYKSIVERQKAIGKRIQEIELEHERLEQRNRENKMPNRTYYTREEIETMSNEEMEA